jgi:Tol biopolymer transport system component
VEPIALPPGRRLGPYEIVAPIGAGGMGEVYRARDTRLQRDVAIKVLPAGSVAEPDRRTRFEYEARAAAALNHPNIVAVFDFGTEDDAPYIVSELLDGETVAERLRRGPLPVRNAVEYAVQIARGLAAAHDRNIVHRDLKPANVFLTTDGRAKILDFGLAKLTQPLTALPTDSVVPTTPAGTTPGIAFGTVGYMAPEQVRGQAVDHRADIFAFGVLLYEMVTGTRAFERETPPETLTAILREDLPEAPLTARHVPPALGRIIRRCVEKNPSGRFQSALDLAFALEATDSASGSSGAIAVEPTRGTVIQWRPWIVAAVVSVAAIAFAMLTKPEPEAPPAAPMLRFTLAPPRGDGVTLSAFAAPSLSPDGTRVAFATGTRVWVQALDELAPRSVAPNGGGQAIFWSPDSTLVAYNLGTTLRVVDGNGANERTICQLPTQYLRGGTWNADGVIVIGAQGRGLMRCLAGGGQFAALTTLNAERRENGHFGPTFLPDGRRLLYWAQPSGTVWLTSLDGGTPKELLNAESVVRYVEPGFLVFVRRGALVAQRFDLESEAVIGEPVPVVEQVLSDQGFFTGSTFDVSPGGTLVYRTGFVRGPSVLQWVDRRGQPVGAPLGSPGLFLNPNLSRDGRQLAIERIDQQTRTADILLMDFARSNVFTRFTSDPGNDTRPVWSPDGEWIAFASDRGGIENIYRRRVHGAAAEELVLQTDAIVPASWPSPSLLLYQRLAPSNLGLLTLGPPAQARILDESRALVIDRWGDVSPDGKWLVFASQEAGSFQLYVQSFPNPDGGRWMVTRGGLAVYPRWAPGGDELFYIAGDGALMSVPVTGTESLAFGTPVRLFDPKTVFGSSFGQGRDQQYAVAPDGQRFLINTPIGEAAQSPMTVLINWQKLLSR